MNGKDIVEDINLSVAGDPGANPPPADPAPPSEPPPAEPPAEPDLAQLQSQLANLQPYYDAYNEFGEPDAVKPFLGIVKTLTSPQFSAPKLAQQMFQLDGTGDIYADLVWDGINRNIEAVTDYIARTPELAQIIAAKLPGITQRRAGQTGAQPSGQVPASPPVTVQPPSSAFNPAAFDLDPENPQHASAIAYFQNLESQVGQMNTQMQQAEAYRRQQEAYRQQQAQAQRAQAGAQYAQGIYNWLSGEVSKFNWPEEYRDYYTTVVNEAISNFDNDPQAVQYFEAARQHIERDPRAMNNSLLAQNADKAVRAKFGTHLKKAAEKMNRLIKQQVDANAATRAAQQVRKDIPPGSGKQPILPGSGTGKGTNDVVGNIMESLRVSGYSH